MMSTYEHFGTPLMLSVWHDNSGKTRPGWFLEKIVLVDLNERTWLVLVVNKEIYFNIYLSVISSIVYKFDATFI